jgi:hypothetical protein
MIDSQTAAVLQGIIRREGRSLLQYVNHAFPWTRGGENERLGQLHMLVQEERDATAEVARCLIRNRVAPPYLGAYPMGFTTYNFVSLDSLVPRLLEYQRQAIANLEGELAHIHDPDARAVVQRLLETKQRHLKTLESLPAAPGASVSA